MHYSIMTNNNSRGFGRNNFFSLPPKNSHSNKRLQHFCYFLRNTSSCVMLLHLHTNQATCTPKPSAPAPSPCSQPTRPKQRPPPSSPLESTSLETRACSSPPSQAGRAFAAGCVTRSTIAVGPPPRHLKLPLPSLPVHHLPQAIRTRERLLTPTSEHRRRPSRSNLQRRTRQGGGYVPILQVCCRPTTLV